MTDNELRALLYDLTEDANCPIEKRHIDRIESIEWIDYNTVRFTIDRHPHLFGAPTVGGASSAFANFLCQYELDIQNEMVKEINFEFQGFYIDYDQLAFDNVDIFINGDTSYIDFELRKLNTKKEVIKYAENKFNDYSWFDAYEDDPVDVMHDYKHWVELPKDFRIKLEEAFKNEKDRMMRHWEVLKEEEAD